MPLKKRPIDRDLGVVRDATLIVIASEDTHAVEIYFARFRPRRVQFRVLPTEDGRSAPEHIVARLDSYRTEFELDEDDQLWYCGDIDHWATGNHLPNLTRVLTLCRQKGYFVAFSNPCFELWNLLHFQEHSANLDTCEAICAALSLAAGGYSKDVGCQARLTADMVRAALNRAEHLDHGTGEIPTTPTTRIHLILRKLIERESIDLAVATE